MGVILLKRAFSVFLVSVLLLTAMLPAQSGLRLSFTANAAEDSAFDFHVGGGVVTITGCDTTLSGAAEIPAEYCDMPVTSVAQGAFRGCKSITSVVIPDSITSIGLYAFDGCSALTSITVDSGNTAFSSSGGSLYSKNGAELVRVPEGTSGSFAI